MRLVPSRGAVADCRQLPHAPYRDLLRMADATEQTSLAVCAHSLAESKERGQGTVEAAVVLPSVMLVFALLLQPVCLSYTRAIMRDAAGECARAVATAYKSDIAPCKEFAFKRLEAVPNVPLFHVGGKDDWVVDIGRSDDHVQVTITGHARPLPIMGALASLASMSDSQGVVLRVDLSENTRPSWVGGSYADWQRVWG